MKLKQLSTTSLNPALSGEWFDKVRLTNIAFSVWRVFAKNRCERTLKKSDGQKESASRSKIIMGGVDLIVSLPQGKVWRAQWPTANLHNTDKCVRLAEYWKNMS